MDRAGRGGQPLVNRGTTGAIVQRQPFGGWKRSAVGAGAKAGGPNYLFGLGDWAPAGPGSAEGGSVAGRTDASGVSALAEPVARLIRASRSALDDAEYADLAAAAASDERAWREEFGVAVDVSGLGIERNVFRYRPVEVAVRIAAGAPVGAALRVLAAAVRSGSPVSVTTGVALAPEVLAALRASGVEVTHEADGTWLERMRRADRRPARVRLVGGDRTELCAATGGTPDLAVWDHAPTAAGRVELLPFLREQAVSITNHRFGNPTTLSDGAV